jgi:hypothetical protein
LGAKGLATESDLHREAELSDRVTADVAHALNNQLALITNYAAFAAEAVDHAVAVDAALWAPVAADLERVRRAAQSAVELTAQLRR